MSREDPTRGFGYDASQFSGHVFGKDLWSATEPDQTALSQRLLLGSHLAHHIRLQLEEQKGYTSTVGVSTNKLLSKLVGNQHKPTAQTTLLPPYDSISSQTNNVEVFIDGHEVGGIPGIGFKSAQKLRQHVLGRRAETIPDSLITFHVKDQVKVRQIRTSEDMGVQLLDRLLAGAGSPHDIGVRVWGLLHGVDITEVEQARDVPHQISIEDSYIRLTALDEVQKQLKILATSLIRRMHVDLTADADAVDDANDSMTAGGTRQWLAHAKTLRLSTRPRAAVDPDGGRARSFNRLSRSAPVPAFLYDLNESIDTLADRLVAESLLPLFRKLHPEKNGWNLSLVNVAVTNIVEVAGAGRSAIGRNIGAMFKNQDDFLKEWKVEDRDMPPSQPGTNMQEYPEDREQGWEAAESVLEKAQAVTGDLMMETLTEWDSEDDALDETTQCPICFANLPNFAFEPHLRYHEVEG